MKSRTPVPRSKRPPLPDFAPVPRKCARHDGWTPERQKAFIEALADTGSVSRAAAQVNMTPRCAYYLRRQAGADEFRRAWEAALDFGVARMKDIAFERAIDGYLVPCFVGGKLLGWRRKYNDRLLMFCLRHYGEDSNGKRTMINYFSTRATAGAAALSSSPERERAEARSLSGGQASTGGMVEGSRPVEAPQPLEAPQAAAEASTTTVRTVITGKGEPADLAASLDRSTTSIEQFEGIELDDRARDEILAVLRDCAERRRLIEGTADDPEQLFIAAEQPPVEMLIHDPGYKHPRKERRRPPPVATPAVPPEHFLEGEPRLLVQPDEQHRSGPGEFSWEMLDQEAEMARIEEAVESVKQAKLAPPRNGEGDHPQDGGGVGGA